MGFGLAAAESLHPWDPQRARLPPPGSASSWAGPRLRSRNLAGRLRRGKARPNEDFASRRPRRRLGPPCISAAPGRLPPKSPPLPIVITPGSWTGPLRTGSEPLFWG